MNILYFDCFSGASGDMILGALLDAGLPLEDLRAALGSLALGDVKLEVETRRPVRDRGDQLQGVHRRSRPPT